MNKEEIDEKYEEFLKACKKAPRKDLIDSLYKINMVAEGAVDHISRLTRQLEETTSIMIAALETLRINGLEVSPQFAAACISQTKLYSEDYAKKYRSDTKQLIDMELANYKWLQARKGADAVHNKDGGSRDIKAKVIAMWAAGDKYTSRDACAEDAAYIFDKSFKSMRAHLSNTPDPDPWEAKKRALAAKKKNK